MKKFLLTLIFIMTSTLLPLYAREVPTEQKIAGLYVAFFNRAPDKGGLDWWKNRADTVQANGQDASSVFRELSAGFAKHPVFTSTYDSLDNEAFVRAIYINALGRAGDEQGIKFWTDDLNKGLSRSDMVASFVELSLTLDLTPQNFPSLTAEELNAAKLRQDLITNKTLVAVDFVNELGDKTNVADSQNPENDPAYVASIKILSKVNEDATTMQDAIEYLKNIKTDSDAINEIINRWKGSCIVDTFSKSDPSSDHAICIKDLPQNECKRFTSVTDDISVSGYLLESSCEALGFDPSTKDIFTDEHQREHDKYFKDETLSTYFPANTEDMFPEVNATALLRNTPKTKIETISNNAIFQTQPNTQAAILSQSDITAETNSSLELNTTLDTANLNKPLFVDGKFKGIVSGINGTTVSLKNANDISEVYDHLELDMKTDQLKTTIARAIASGKIKGQYDYLNTKPLKITLVTSSNTPSRSLTQPKIRIEFPKGYKVPIEPRSVSCSFLSGECNFILQNVTKSKIPLSVSTDPDSFIVFTTEGSYMEYGIGTNMNIYYNHNFIAKDDFAFTYIQAANFDAQLDFKLSAEPTQLSDNMSWEKNFKPLGGMEIEIAQPYSEIVKTEVILVPTITLGIEGKISGSLQYHTKVSRKGEIRAKYDSRTGEHTLFSNIKDTANKLDENSIQTELEASASAYCFPNFTFIPAVRLLRISDPLQFAELRAGIKLDNTISGKLEKGFIASADGLITKSGSEIRVASFLNELVQGKWSVKYGEGEDHVFYESENYTDILKSDPYNIFEWKMQALSDPKFIVKDDPNDPSIKLLTFDSDDEKYRGYLHYFYTLSDKDDASTDIDINTIDSHQPVYTPGDQPIQIKKNTIVKVVAVLYNKDVSDSIWSFGKSVSKQVKKSIVNVMAPTISPSSTAFNGSLDVTLAQAQGYDIYYKINGGTPQLYTTPIVITDTATIDAYASTTIDGIKTLSKEVSASYTKCGDGEDVQNGECVAITCNDGEVLQDGQCVPNGDEDNNSSETAWDNWPNPQWCPMKDSEHAGRGYNVNEKNKDEYGFYKDYVHCFYYENSQLSSEIPYIDYVANGIEKGYYESGQLASETPRTNGLINGVEKIYYESGQLKSETPYQNSEKNGVAKEYYEWGQLKSEISYKNDRYNGIMKTYNTFGQLIFEGIYDNGKENGIFKNYCENGQVSDIVTYKEGKKIGVEKTYYCSGELSGEAPYKEGYIDGIAKDYYKSGQLESEWPYKDGVLDGTVKMYNENGCLTDEIIWEDGSYVDSTHYGCS